MAEPDLPSTGRALTALAGHVATVASTDRELDYRALVFRTPDGYVKVVAQPLTEVDEAVSSLTGTFLFAGVAMVIIGAAVSWLVIRRSLRPVEGMIDTATAIASGDLSQRVDHRDDGSELGRLADALDEMLGQLEASFTERLAAQSRLEQFVADASHELRTPVTAIRGYAELYREGGLAPGEQLDRAMRRIEQESARMGTLVEDLLLLARLDEQQPLERQPVDVGVLAEDAVTDARAVDTERPITLCTTPSAYVLGDEQRLRQVVANLLTNARVHTPPRTPVHVRVERRDGHVELTVADEGPGIVVDDRQRIFERFSRADRSRSRASAAAPGSGSRSSPRWSRPIVGPSASRMRPTGAHPSWSTCQRATSVLTRSRRRPRAPPARPAARTRDRLAVLVDEELLEVPADVAGVPLGIGDGCELVVERVPTGAVHLDLLGKRERHAVRRRAEGRDLLGASRLLLEELVARDAEHREPSVLVALVDPLETLVLGREAALRRHVDDERHLPALRSEQVRAAVERVDRDVVDRHAGHFSMCLRAGGRSVDHRTRPPRTCRRSRRPTFIRRQRARSRVREVGSRRCTRRPHDTEERPTMVDDWTTTLPAGWYVCRRIPAPHTEAMRALGDALRADPLLLSLGPDFTIDRVEHLRLGETRGFTGRLRLGLAGSIRVELEIEPWSRTESVIAVRPLRRAPRAHADRYFAHTLEALAALETCVLERIVTPGALEVRRRVLTSPTTRGACHDRRVTAASAAPA